MLRTLISILIRGLLPILYTHSIAGENRSFEQERLQLIRDFHSYLISTKACKDLKDCQQKQLLFVSPAQDGISIQIWNHPTSDPTEAEIKTALSTFNLNKKIKTISIDFFKVSKQQSLKEPFWKKTSADTEIILRRRNNAQR